jgi:hypothetical protein
LTEFHLDEKCVCASGLCTGVDNPRFSHNENSGSRDGGRIVIMTDGTTSDRIPEAVRDRLGKGEVNRRRTLSTGFEKWTLGRP